MRRFAIIALWCALGAQATWLVIEQLASRPPALNVQEAIILAAFTVFAASLHGRRRPWLCVVVRAIMAADFVLAVADRLGILGPHGAPGVSWGDFSHFVAYTRSVAAFAPGRLPPVLAVFATIAELTLGMALLLGVRLQLTSLLASLLLCSYGLSMTISLPAGQQFNYCVFVLAAGMLALSHLPRSPLSVDAILTRLRRPNTELDPETTGAS